MLLGFYRSLWQIFVTLYMVNTLKDIKVLKHFGLILVWAQDQLMHHYGLWFLKVKCVITAPSGSKENFTNNNLYFWTQCHKVGVKSNFVQLLGFGIKITYIFTIEENILNNLYKNIKARPTVSYKVVDQCIRCFC